MVLLSAALADLDRPLVVDLAGLSDCDSAGACMLGDGAGGRPGDRLRRVPPAAAGRPTPAVCGVLAASGVLDMVAAFHTVDSAARDNPRDLLPGQPDVRQPHRD